MKKLLAIISLILGITAVNAQQAATQEKSGLKPYVGLDAGSNAIIAKTGNISVDTDLGIALSVNVGLMLNQSFGVEAFYSDLGSVTQGLDYNNTVSFNSYGVLAKGQYRFNSSDLFLYGKFGLGTIEGNGYGESIYNNSIIVDVGVAYQLVPQSQITLGYNKYFDQVVSDDGVKYTFSTFSLGLNYSF